VFILSPSEQLPVQYLKCCTVAVTQAINKPSKNLTEIISSFANTGEQYASARQLSRSVLADAGFLGEKTTVLGDTIKWTHVVGNILSSGL
jgi:type 1 glutamine amidotransferase